MRSALAHRPASVDLWHRFQEGRCTPDELERDLMLRRWARCRDAGLPADGSGEPAMAMVGLAEAVDAFAPLLAPGAPFEAFATALAREGFCGVLADPTGRVLARRISEPFEATIVRERLIEGAVWSEGARGTNGVGTTLFEQRPVAIVGPDHYERRNHVFACYGAPIRDVRERVVGVLDATGPASCAGAFVHASVVAAAAAIEALIIGRAYDAATPGGLFALELLLARLPHAALIIETSGRVRRTNAPFRTLVLHRAENPLADRLSALARVGALQSGRARRDLPRGTVIDVEPVGDPGDPIAAIVHLRPRAARPVPAAAPEQLPEGFAAIVGSDPVITVARSRAARFARTDMPVLLLGETGTGKELFARAVHAASPRAAQPFVAVNAGTLTGSLLESELFGYAPGAFTGADPAGRTGKLEAARGGTLFLDEVGELSPGVQAMLLRFLEGGTFYRVGESAERTANVRLIAATHRDLPALVGDGRFRSDLYFRLRGVVLHLPPLRQRRDHGELARTVLAAAARKHGFERPLDLSPAALAWIERQPWPGNVRELRTALEYATVMAADAPRIELWHLPVDQAVPAPDRAELLSSAEREAVLRALDRSRGNLSEAARQLGVARSTLYRMLERHGLREAPHRTP
jgi:transcriptional regulator of acetoin/glycerol metabolism